MRLLQIMASRQRGGAEAFFSRLCVALAQSPIDKRVPIDQTVVIRNRAACRDDLIAGGLKPIEMPFLFNGDPLTRHRLGRLIAARSPDVVLSWMSRAATTCPKGRFVHVGRLGGYYDLKYYAACDHLIANTQDIADYVVAHGWPRPRVHYLPNFVDERPAAAVDRASLGTPADVPVILALGRLHSDKAFDVLLKAMAAVPRAHLWLAGEGPLDASLKQLAGTLGVAARVHFLGWRTDVAALLGAADCLACPSRIEPLGNVILEAWAHRRPVVVAASKGPLGLVRNEDTGLVVALEDEAALALALRRVLEDKALAAGLAARGHTEYQARFGKEAVTALYRDFLLRVAV
ncbi:MAG: glycosyltransferase [Alphaproteobacteria bacterium]|nr:glycosyltransferase [Alphaproteobacteria bacterium]